MAFNTRRTFEEPMFDPTNPYGEEPPEVYPPMLPGQRPSNVPPSMPWWDDPNAPRPQPQPSAGPPGSIPAGGQQPLPQPGPLQGNPVQMPIGGMSPQPQPLPSPQRPNRPMPRPSTNPEMLEPYIKSLDPSSAVRKPMNAYEGSVIRESELNRGYDKQRDNPYSDTNFYKPGGLGDQMRFKEYHDNDNMMNDVLNTRTMDRRTNPGSYEDWLKNRTTQEDKRLRDEYDRERDPGKMSEYKKRLHDEMLQAEEYSVPRTIPAIDMNEARKKGINPVPWERRNRAL